MSSDLNFIQTSSNYKIQILDSVSTISSFELYKIHGDWLLEQHRLFLADGEKTVTRLLASKLKIKEILCLEKYLTKNFIELMESHPEIEKVYVGTITQLREVRGFDLHQGIMALAYLPNLNSTLMPPIFVGNKILEANNWGSLIRSLSAFGIYSLVFDKSSCHPYIRRSVRVSMGTIFQMNLTRVENLPEFLKFYYEKGFKIYGTGLPKLSKKIVSFWDWNPPLKSLIILGNEDKGIENDLEPWIHEFVWIPIENSVDSLNVAVAGAILASHFKRT